MIKYLIISITLFLINEGYSQSLTGNTGLFNIPTAEILNDGEIAFGVNYLDKKFIERDDRKYSAISYYATVGYMPFLEISLRLTRYVNYPYPQSMGDRMPSIRIKIISESKVLPSVLIGAQDFMSIEDYTSAVNFNALYIVSTKYFNIKKSFINRIGFHLGYGTDWLKANHRQFVGIFGGISVEHKNFLKGMVEYDADKFNIGAEVTIFNHIKIMAGLLHFDSFNAGICYKTNLF